MSWQAPGYAHRLDLGGGNAGRAVLAVHEETGDLVVIRYLAIERANAERVRTDLADLSAVASPYFADVREVLEHDEGIAVVTSAVNGANLRHVLRDTGAVGAEAALLVFHESLTGLSAAHTVGVCHGDYRPENILVDASGDIRMIDARAIAWSERDITLGTGVYLAPERWRGDEITAASDVYAATVTFVEMLAGEPPYWEDSQLITLRYRHEQEEIPSDGVPVAMRDIVRLGLAKQPEYRGEAVALLELVDLTAIAEYGEDWADVGRAQLVTLAAAANPALAAREPIDESEMTAAGELVELDDYYTDMAAADAAGLAVAASEHIVFEDDAPDEAAPDEAAPDEAAPDQAAPDEAAPDATAPDATAPDEAAPDQDNAERSDVASAIAAAEVVAAAAEIVELARIEEMAAGASLGTEEDVLTEEEEAAVAEVSEIVVAAEAAEEASAVGVAPVEGTAIAATDAELDEIDVAAAEGVVFESVTLESQAAQGEVGEGSIAAGLIAGGAVAEGAVAEEAAGAAAAGGIPPSESPSGATPVPFRRRHPWILGIAAVVLIILCTGGGLAWTGKFPGGSTPNETPTPIAATTDTATSQGGVVPPVTSPSPSPSGTPGGVVPVTSPSVPPVSPPSSGGTSTSTGKPPASHHPKPTPSMSKLPVTGAATSGLFGAAAVLLLAGVVLMIWARRRRA